MKNNDFSRKKRQLGRLVQELQLALKKGESPSLVERLKLKISYLLNQLIGAVSKQQLKGILGSLAVVFGLAVSNSANAQNFAVPVANPFGIATDINVVAIPELVDIDGDGDLDLFSGGYYGVIEYYENTGTATAPAFTTGVQNPFGLTNAYGNAFVTTCDIDNDGDFDMLVGEYYGNMQYFENMGTAVAPAFAAAVQNPYGLSATYQVAIPVFTDLDGDGDFDILVGEAYYGNMQYFENTGTVLLPNFSTAPVQNPFGLTPVAFFAIPESVDLDGDGDFDLLVGEYYGNAQYFENTGTNLAPAFAAPVLDPFGIVNNEELFLPSIGDIDGDGDLDLISGSYDGLIQYFENTSNVSLVELENEANVFPNPFTDIITIETNSVIERVEIYSLSGQLLLAIDQPGKTINLDSLEVGIYMLHAISDEGLKTCNKLEKL